jgi:hypothetical protein
MEGPGNDVQDLGWGCALGLAAMFVAIALGFLVLRKAALTWRGEIFTDEARNWKDCGFVLAAVAIHHAVMVHTITSRRRRRAERSEQ